MTEQERENLMSVIRKKFMHQVHEQFDIAAYLDLSYFDVMNCLEREVDFEDFELALTTSIYKKIKSL